MEEDKSSSILNSHFLSTARNQRFLTFLLSNAIKGSKTAFVVTLHGDLSGICWLNRMKLTPSALKQHPVFNAACIRQVPALEADTTIINTCTVTITA